MVKENRVIRDFIYVDVDLLYSLYSQVFEGVADQIIKSYVALESRSDISKNLLASSNLETQVAEASRRTESTFLYDHMYNLLEDKIKSAILENPDLSKDDFREVLDDAFVLKIDGAAEIEDYARIKEFMGKFNDIAGAIAYAGMISDEGKGDSEIENEINRESDRNTKAKLRALQKAKKNPKKLAEAMGIAQDETLLNNLIMFTDMFNPEGFEITVVPMPGDNKVVYRGILNRKWLRMEPKFLRSLFGGYAEGGWTMVGKVTYLPGATIPDIDDEDDEDDVSEDEEPAVSMRDAFRAMFNKALAFDRITLESDSRIEIIMSPLAIYREKTICLKEDVQQ